jgi:murein L,D-transpeptidase YafK
MNTAGLKGFRASMLCTAMLLAPAWGAAQEAPHIPGLDSSSSSSGPLRVNYTPPARSSSQWPQANRVVVHKSARRLELLRGGEILRSYRIALGLAPQGHKERAGDFRTPEGRYMLTRRNPRSDFFLSIQVSYPSKEDIRRAKKNGYDPGGAIMIHGMPNRLRHDPDYYLKRDWTDGCIAVSNSDMVEIWLLAQDDIPIDILP